MCGRLPDARVQCRAWQQPSGLTNLTPGYFGYTPPHTSTSQTLLISLSGRDNYVVVAAFSPSSPCWLEYGKLGDEVCTTFSLISD